MITTLTKEALPLIRYRTRDITRITRAPCSCGRSHLRINRITGRNDDMLIIRGVNVYPSQVEAVLLGLDGIAAHYQLVVERRGSLDELTIEVETQRALSSHEERDLERKVAPMAVIARTPSVRRCTAANTGPRPPRKEMSSAEKGNSTPHAASWNATAAPK